MAGSDRTGATQVQVRSDRREHRKLEETGKPKRLLCLHLRSKRLQRLKPDVKICRHEREVNQKERLAHHACARKNLFETFRKEVLTVVAIIRRRRRGRP